VPSPAILNGTIRTLEGFDVLRGLEVADKKTAAAVHGVDDTV
jgi:hypothetical protein